MNLARLPRSFAVLCLLAACNSADPAVAPEIAEPNEPAIRNFTSFAESLRCMDHLFKSYGKPRVLVTSTGFPDQTNEVRISADDMLVGAVNAMNQRSGAYVFVDQAFSNDLGQNIYLSQKTNLKPGVYIRGSISQFDEDLIEEEGRAPLVFSVFGDVVNLVEDASINASRTISIVTVDMHLVKLPEKTVIPGASVTNSIILTEDGYGAGLSGFIAGGSFELNLQIDEIESRGQAVRNLIELGSIELLGRHAKVPYWKCLSVEETDPGFERWDRKQFRYLPHPAKVSAVRKMMVSLGRLRADHPGGLDAELRWEISRFQAEQNLIATGLVDYDLYARLTFLTDGRRPVPLNPRQVVLELLSAPPRQKGYDAGDHFVAAATVDRAAYLTCVYQPEPGTAHVVFPQGAGLSHRIDADSRVRVPAANAGFDIVLDKPGRSEAIRCFAEAKAGPGSVAAALRGRAVTENVAAILKNVPEASVAERTAAQVRAKVAIDPPAEDDES
ncbi:MAG: DUF4384 domain-containing protein [Pseudomonadota bacterium]